jgi:hypothetical protein
MPLPRVASLPPAQGLRGHRPRWLQKRAPCPTSSGEQNVNPGLAADEMAVDMNVETLDIMVLKVSTGAKTVEVPAPSRKIITERVVSIDFLYTSYRVGFRPSISMPTASALEGNGLSGSNPYQEHRRMWGKVEESRVISSIYGQTSKKRAPSRFTYKSHLGFRFEKSWPFLNMLTLQTSQVPQGLLRCLSSSLFW